MPTETTDRIDRRSILKVTLGGVVAAAGGLPMMPRALAQTPRKRLDVLLLSSVLQPPVGPMIEKLANVELVNGPYLSAADVIARIMAPGGARQNMYCGVTEILRQPVLGAKAGDERALALQIADIPNLADLTEIAKADMIQRDGRIYGVPTFFGYDTVIYNRKDVKEDETTQSWGLLFDDRYAGRIAWVDNPYYAMHSAALFLGHANPAKATPKEIDDFAKFMISKKKNVRALWQTQAQAINLMSSGEVAISSGQVPIRIALQKRGIDIVTNYPKEGTVLWTMGYFVAKGAAMPKESSAVIDALLDPEVGAAITRQTGYLTASTKAAALLSKEDQAAYGFDIRERGIKLTKYYFPEDLSTYIDAWNRVKSA